MSRLLEENKRKLEKAIKHLEYSFMKLQNLDDKLNLENDEILETWESFAARFSRVADIFLMRYIRSKILLEDPAFNGTFRDHLNQAEKLNIIESAQAWLAIRELRNVTAHEYNEDNLLEFYKKLETETPKLLALRELV